MMNADAIIMNKITQIVIDDNGKISDFTSSIIPKLPVIFFMVAVKKCIENSGDFFYTIWYGLKSLVRKIVYTEKKLINYTDAKTECYYFNKSYQKRKYSFINQILPIYRQHDDDKDIITFSYINWYSTHKKLIHSCEIEAVKDYQDYELSSNQIKVLYKKLSVADGCLNYIDSKSSTLYPSHNYVNLTKIIHTHVSVAKIIKSYSVLGILIDSEPGMGKTKFADFAVNEKLVGHVYKIDMTNMLKYSFSNLLNIMYHKIQITTDTLFMIDELDKYIEYRIDLEYADELKQLSNKKKKNEDNTPVMLDKILYYKQAKTTFLYDMLSILERDGLEYPVIVIFCSNNFQSIFADIDMTHHESLYSRFMKIKFEPCNHQEIIEYIMYYNNMFKNTEYECVLEKIELEKLLRKDIIITHRTLHHISIESKYNAFNMIELLNKIDNIKNDNIKNKKVKNIKNEKVENIKNIKNEKVENIKNEKVEKVENIKNIKNIKNEKVENVENEKVENIKNEKIENEKVENIKNEKIENEKVENEKVENIKNEKVENIKNEKIENEKIENEKIENEYIKKKIGNQNGKCIILGNGSVIERIKKVNDVYEEKTDDELFKEIKKSLKEDVQNEIVLENGAVINRLKEVNGELKTNDELIEEFKTHMDEEHHLVWQNNYTILNNASNKKDIVNKIKNYLSDIDNVSGLLNKKLITAELFDYLSEEGYMIMKDQSFKNTVINKIIEFYIHHQDTYDLLKPSTKEFIYAATGIKY